METSIYHAVVSRKHLVAKELFKELETIKPGLFTDLLRIEGGEPYAKLALMYIIYAYSKESPAIVLGERFAEQKRKIADYVQLPDTMLGPVMNMQNHLVRETVIKYLNAQKDRKWQHYMQDKEMYEAMLDSGIRKMHKEDGSIDHKGMIEGAKYRKELLAQIEAQEAAFRFDGEYGFVIENMNEINKIGKESSGGNSMKLESSPHIK